MTDNNIDYKKLYEKLLIENKNLKDQHLLDITNFESKINSLTQHLKKYTSPARNKKYYENHKEEIIEKVKEYKEKTGYNKKPSAEKIKEYSKRAYEKKKLKILEENNLVI